MAFSPCAVGNVLRRPPLWNRIARVSLPIDERPWVGEAAVQAECLAVHGGRELAHTRAAFMAATKFVTDLMVNHVLAVYLQRNAGVDIIGNRKTPPIEVDDYLTNL